MLHLVRNQPRPPKTEKWILLETSLGSLLYVTSAVRKCSDLTHICCLWLLLLNQQSTKSTGPLKHISSIFSECVPGRIRPCSFPSATQKWWKWPKMGQTLKHQQFSIVALGYCSEEWIFLYFSVQRALSRPYVWGNLYLPLEFILWVLASCPPARSHLIVTIKTISVSEVWEVSVCTCLNIGWNKRWEKVAAAACGGVFF